MAATAHALSNPQRAVVGLLLAGTDAGTVEVTCPLFHNAASKPMAKLALSAATKAAEKAGTQVIGTYYSESASLSGENLAVSLNQALPGRKALVKINVGDSRGAVLNWEVRRGAGVVTVLEGATVGGLVALVDSNVIVDFETSLEQPRKVWTHMGFPLQEAAAEASA